MTPQEENARIQQEVNEQLLAYNEAQRTATKETQEAAAAEEKFAQVTTTALGVLEKLYQAQLRYTLAMAKGQKGTAQFNDGIDAMTDAAQMAAVALSLLVPGGAIIKGVTAGLTFLATQVLKTAAEMQKAANDQADATYKSFQAFSKAGATASGGMTGLFNDVNRMRLNVNQLDAIAGAVAASSKEISAFGGTVYRGQKEFADLVEGMGDFEKGMLNLGMNQEEQAEAVLGYMKIQSQLTLGEQRNYGNQSKAARKFIEEMEVMTKVTGLSRKQQEDVLDRQMSNQRSGAVLDQLREEGKTDAAKLIQKQIQLYAKMGPVAEQGYNDILSGNLQTEAAQKLFRSTNGKVMQDQIDIMEGRVRTDRDAVKATEETVGIMAEQRKNFRESFKAGVEDVLIPFKELGEAAKLKASGLEEAMSDATIQVDKLTGAQGKVEEVTDKYTDVLKKQNDEMLALQKSLHGTFSTAGVGVDGFTSILDRTGGILMDLGKKALELLGVMDADKKRESHLGKDAVKSEMAGASGELGQAAAQGAEAMTTTPKTEDIKSAKDLGFLDRMLVGKENVQKRIALENQGMSPAQAAAAVAQQSRQTPATTKPPTASGQGAPAAPAPAGGAPAAPAPAAPAASAKPTGQPNVLNVNKLLAYLGQKEAAGKYDMLVGMKQYSPLTSMTVAEVQEFQKNMISGRGPTGKHETTAVGKYQIISETLAGLIANGAIKPGDTFNSSTQDRAAIALLKGRGMDAYTSGKISKDEFANRVAQEWASMPLASGKGAYDGTGSNKAGGTRAEYLAAFAKDGGIFDGPKSGYSATLHGNEAVIPLKDGAVPVSMSQEFNMTATNLGELVNQMRSTMGVQERMITVLEEIRRAQTTTADNTSRMAAYASN
jgi:muramidase (phage lysozyme)